MSMPRSNRRYSTFRSDNEYRTYVMTTIRITALDPRLFGLEQDAGQDLCHVVTPSRRHGDEIERRPDRLPISPHRNSVSTDSILEVPHMAPPPLMNVGFHAIGRHRGRRTGKAKAFERQTVPPFCRPRAALITVFDECSDAHDIRRSPPAQRFLSTHAAV